MTKHTALGTIVSSNDKLNIHDHHIDRTILLSGNQAKNNIFVVRNEGHRKVTERV